MYGPEEDKDADDDQEDREEYKDRRTRTITMRRSGTKRTRTEMALMMTTRPATRTTLNHC